MHQNGRVTCKERLWNAPILKEVHVIHEKDTVSGTNNALGHKLSTGGDFLIAKGSAGGLMGRNEIMWLF